jgi:hypothetical protein
MTIFGYALPEVKKAAIAAVYLVFAIVMLAGFIPHVGFEEAVIALIGPTFGVVEVFGATNHTALDLQKALEALKAAAMTAVGFYVAVPANTEQVVGMLVTGIVMAFGVYWTRNAGQGATATPRGP